MSCHTGLLSDAGQEQPDGNCLMSGHVQCNNWPVFAILECYPTRVDEFRPLCDWFLEHQKPNHSWDLVPGHDIEYPLFTAFALNALLQFYQCYATLGSEYSGYLEKLESSVRKGVNYLLSNRQPLSGSIPSLVWCANVARRSETTISFLTSATCLHVLLKVVISHQFGH